MCYGKLYVFAFVCCLIVNGSDSHPQCLDYQPPFRPTGVRFCLAYQDYGCCDGKQDDFLKLSFEYISRLSNSSSTTLRYAKEILCLECHPYAAHIFDAESGNDDGAMFRKSYIRFPGLCKNLCYDLFSKHKSVLLSMFRNADFIQFIHSSNVTTFCSWAEIQDSNYCYPAVNHLDISTQSVVKEYQHKLCVEAYRGPLFANALVAVHSNDQSHRLFVGEQRGLIHVILPNGTKFDEPFLNITDKVINAGVPWDERGLLGLAFHPKFKDNGRFFVYYSAAAEGLQKEDYSYSKWFWKIQHRVRISEFTVDPQNPNMADLVSELPLLEIDQPEPNHNGGMILFGQDGFLYIFVGDGGGSGDKHGIYGNGLSMSTLLGKVLRIDVNTEDDLYGIPADNPFVRYGNTKPEIFALGLRNPWRCSADIKGTGRIFCGDVGQNQYEEINIVKCGRNYGWKAYEGFSCFDKSLCDRQKLTRLEFPILSYSHEIGRSIVGGYIYRGCVNPNWYGKYFFADTMTGRVFVAEENVRNNTWSYAEVEIGNETFCINGMSGVGQRKTILSFGEAEDGELYILSTSTPHPSFQASTLYRLVDPVRRGHPTKCAKKVIEAKALMGRIKRRRVFESYSKTKELRHEKIKKDGRVCKDDGSFCKHYQGSKRRKKPLLDCMKTKHLSGKFCRLTCGFCKT